MQSSIYFQPTCLRFEFESWGADLIASLGQVAVMAQHNVPTVNLHDAIVGKCGAVPQNSCFNQTGCFCPHCPGLWNETIHQYNPGPGYLWVAASTIVPALTKLLPAVATTL